MEFKKRAIAMLLAISMSVSACPMSAWAEEAPAEAPDVISIDIEWGSMNFTYTEGIWNTDTHSYENGEWSDSGSGYVTVVNKGTADTTVEFLFASERTEISGSFLSGLNAVNGAVNVAAGQTQTVYLVLIGKPTEEFNKEKIGTVTIRIGGE